MASRTAPIVATGHPVPPRSPAENPLRARHPGKMPSTDTLPCLSPGIAHQETCHGRASSPTDSHLGHLPAAHLGASGEGPAGGTWCGCLGQEDRRQFHRELEDLKAERPQHINWMKGLLAGQGVRLEIEADFLERLSAIRLWDGRPMPERLKARLEGEYERWQFIQGRIHELEAQRVEEICRSADPDAFSGQIRPPIPR